MSNLYTATKQDGKLFCGYCYERIAYPTILTEIDGGKLVQCPHCFRLNKVKENLPTSLNELMKAMQKPKKKGEIKRWRLNKVKQK